ncbi:MAG TPA: ATP-binding protein [Burkholderiales bacterium]|nr:ATP-binding protein [Burkholderiales bacterium]
MSASAPAPPAAGVVSPHEADARLAVDFLRDHGIRALVFESLTELALGLDTRIGCAVLTEESLVAAEIPALREAIARLPAWADLPLIFIAREVSPLVLLGASAFPDSGNVTLLERPLNPHTLVSAVQVALRATARQREVGELLTERESALRLRDEFIAMLAHELRNPLAPMRNALYLLRAQGTADPTIQQSSAILERQIGHIVRIVDDLMDVARLERGKVTLQRRRVDLNRVVSSAVDSCLPAAQPRGHKVSVRLNADALPVDADAVRVEQIVCNLVHNAIKFTPAPGEIVVETTSIGGEAVVSVQDPGVGFEPQAAEKLFAPFLQVNPTLERSAGGLGIGLTIVRRLVELHGGSVVGSSPGSAKGARFVVRLPLAAGLAEPEPAQRPVLHGKRQRVVVIEDNDDIRESLTSILQYWGHEVTAEADGHAGLARVLATKPDIALVDLGLPGLNGYDVARRIRAAVPNGAMRLIAITGYGQPADRERAAEAGFDAHLLKPVAPEALARELQG